MITAIHQTQLARLRYDKQDWLLSFHDWLEQHVGKFDKDWGRSYNLNLASPEYGTTWWFRDPEMATLTLLTWS